MITCATPPPRGLKLSSMVIPAVVLCISAVVSVAKEPTLEAALLHRLIGTWQGRAEQTPIGPTPYDIAFSRMGDGAVYGVADPGLALHHWRFLVVDGHLRLRFLSTFRGNKRPMWLYAESLTETAAHFRGRDRDHVTVHVEPGEQDLKLDIFLRDKPHVSIRLERMLESP